MASPEEMLATMHANLPEKTGKPLEDWLEIIAQSPAARHGEIVKILKSEHGVTHGFANLIAHEALKTDTPVDLVAEQYAGAKAALRPLHDAIVDFCRTLGEDVTMDPKKTSVSLRRKKQFALITPATKTRIDLGLALKGEAETGRLENYNAMCSHRIRLEDPNSFDDEVKTWIRTAYDRAG